MARIGLPRGDEVSVPALGALVRAHLEQIPFENLDIAESGGCVVSLNEDDLYEKIVERGRGGYCFELNKLFYLLLRELGYDCYPVAARIPYRRDELRPLGHRATIVRLDGKKWFCDVGYGGPGPKGMLCLSDKRPQNIYGEYFSPGAAEDGTTAVIRHDPDRPRVLIAYRDEPWPEVDFETINAYFSMHPDSVFTQKTIVYRCIPDGQLGLVADRFTVSRPGRPDETRAVSDPEERVRLLRETFGIRI